MDIHAYYQSQFLTGHVRFDKAKTNSVVVSAYKEEAGRSNVVRSVRLNAPGHFELIVPEGAYRIFAFDDANANDTLDVDEMCSAPVAAPRLSAQGVSTALQIEFTGTAEACALPVGTRFTGPHGAGLQPSTVGLVHQLDSETQSDSKEADGYWRPTEYLLGTGSKLVFNERYDPAKIPIIFVHGAAGSPQDWRYFVDNIDHDRFQAWIFHYASGAPLDECAEQLYRNLADLHVSLQPRLLAIAAHSMGGLVARKLIVSHGAQLPSIKLFVSLSTPWGGDSFAETGTKWSPIVVPSWLDLIPDGRFLRSLFVSPLPASVEHYLFFGHRGSPGWARSNNDGTVSLASQLTLPAQAEAVMVLGFDEDHFSILSSPDVMRQFNGVLNAFVRDQDLNVESMATAPLAAKRRPSSRPVELIANH